LGFSRRRGCRRRRRPRRRGWGRGACRARRRVARPRRAGRMRWRRWGKRRGLGGRFQSKQLPWWCDVTLVEGDATGVGSVRSTSTRVAVSVRTSPRPDFTAIAH
jgi:hypothetical protein